ncbi:hypothetical protein BDE02_05G097200 [Populus trichocarpa]|nr:hypothetical protein BDE02_05G097200 [Populus trichocarpa]
MGPSTLTALAEEKTLQASFVRDEDERPKVAYNQFSNEIPVISIAGIDDGGEKRAEICNKIVEACEEWGVFQIVDHGVDAKLVSEMTTLAKEFFALPPEEKLRFDMSGGKKGGFIVSSHLQGEAVQDWREIVTFFSYPIRTRDYSRWPDKPEAWKAVTEEYSKKLMELACKLIGVLSEAMGLETEALTKACVDMDQKNLHLDSNAILIPAPSPSCSRTPLVVFRPLEITERLGSPFNLLKVLLWSISETMVIILAMEDSGTQTTKLW